MNVLFRHLLVTFVGTASYIASAQDWCVPASLIPYSTDMPGITRFQLNTIDRVSADLENYPNNSYVHTGLGTTLIAGETYPVTIEFTVHAAICPDMNLRIWMDLNHDGQLDDAGETLLSVDHVWPNTYNGSITIPADAMLGATRMRVTAKMSDLGFHTLPTPCDLPPDPFGYHGEMEDYDIEIVLGTDVDEISASFAQMSFTQEGNDAHVRLLLERTGKLHVDLYDPRGALIATLFSGSASAGDMRLRLPQLGSGIYYVRSEFDGLDQVLPVVMSR